MHLLRRAPRTCLQRFAPAFTCFRRTITTLNPAKLSTDDYVDISGAKRYKLYLPNGRDTCRLIYRQIKYAADTGHAVGFPIQAKGFFYFACGPTKAPLVGELRFRVTADPSPRSFHKGRDLALPHSDAPWKVPVASLARFRVYSALCDALQADGVLSQDLVKSIQAAPARSLRAPTMVHSLGQPFVLQMDNVSDGVYVTGGSEIWRVYSSLPWTSRTGSRVHGRLLCCFEAASTRGGNATLIFRLLKILEPIKYDGTDEKTIHVLSKLSEGQLIYRHDGALWTAGLAHRRAPFAAVRALCDGKADMPGYIPTRPMRKDPESTDNVLRSIRHLRPERLSDSDLMDWSGVRSASVKFEGSPDVHELQWQPRTTKAAPQDFPAGTFGFLYVHVHPVHAALSQLRFRIAAGADKFADGHDLMLPSGIPWHVAVPGLLANRTGAYVKDILVKDGLVSEENCDHWAVRLGVNAHARLIVPGDSFEIGLDIRDITAHLVHGREWCTMRMEMPIKLRRILKSDPALRSMRARVCIEELADAPGFALRILDVYERGQPISEATSRDWAFPLGSSTWKRYQKLLHRL